MIPGEIRKMHQEFRPDALAVRIQREKFHPARIDADERPARGRRQAGDRPIVPLGPARDRDAVAAVAVENLQDLLRLRLRLAEQLLEPRDILETQFRKIRALLGVAQDRLALHPIALLLEIQESAETGRAPATSRAHVRYHVSAACWPSLIFPDIPDIPVTVHVILQRALDRRFRLFNALSP